MITPNEDELPSLSINHSSIEHTIQELLNRGLEHLWLRKGANGSEIISLTSRYSLPSATVPVKDITGAGDAALAAWIAAYCLGMTAKQCMLAAHAMAANVIQVSGAVDHTASQKKLFDSIKTYFPNEQ